MKILIFTIFLIFQLLSNGILAQIDVCTNFYQGLLDDSIVLKNAIPSRNSEFQLGNNTQRFSDCIEQCCSNFDCNIAYFVKASKKCYLITCKTQEQCERVELRESFIINEISSYMLYVHPIKLIQEKHESTCNPLNSSSCRENESCVLNESNEYHCECDLKSNLKRINGICREFSTNASRCDFDLKNCSHPNEECLEDKSNLSTCQCKLGFKRLGSQCISVTKTHDINTTRSSSTTSKISTKSLSIVLPEYNQNVIVDAGSDQFISYPTQMCILNASNSKTLDGSQIIKYKWEKTELSPAIGNFVLMNDKSSSNNKIAFVENLIRGIYTFSLKIWTDKSGDKYYQDTVQVYVHLYSNNDTNRLTRLILPIHSLNFNEMDEYLLVTKLQNMLLKPPTITNPLVHITNIYTDYELNKLIVEFYVTNDVKTQVTNEKNELVDSIRSHSIESDVIFQILRKSFHNNEQSDEISFFNLNKHNLKQLKCYDNCSSHGTCDNLTYNCICDQYWMPNLYKYYFLVENDLTNGNNCEWNVFYVILISLTIFVLFFLISYFCFYCSCRACFYICCSSCKEKPCLVFLCSCLSCKKQRRPSQIRIQKSPVSSKLSLFKKIGRNKSNTESKYTLLGNMDDESFQFKDLGKKQKQERTYGLHSSDEEINVKLEDSDEDVLYDTSSRSNNSNLSSKRIVPTFNEKLV